MSGTVHSLGVDAELDLIQEASLEALSVAQDVFVDLQRWELQRNVAEIANDEGGVPAWTLRSDPFGGFSIAPPASPYWGADDLDDLLAIVRRHNATLVVRPSSPLAPGLDPCGLELRIVIARRQVRP